MAQLCDVEDLLLIDHDGNVLEGGRDHQICASSLQ